MMDFFWFGAFSKHWKSHKSSSRFASRFDQHFFSGIRKACNWSLIVFFQPWEPSGYMTRKLARYLWIWRLVKKFKPKPCDLIERPHTNMDNNIIIYSFLWRDPGFLSSPGPLFSSVERQNPAYVSPFGKSVEHLHIPWSMGRVYVPLWMVEPSFTQDLWVQRAFRDILYTHDLTEPWLWEEQNFAWAILPWYLEDQFSK